jgi:hypothetical protein
MNNDRRAPLRDSSQEFVDDEPVQMNGHDTFMKTGLSADRRPQ